MAFRDFSFPQVQHDLGLTLHDADLFASAPPFPVREEFAAFLTQFLGGPTEYSQRRWWLSLRESHLRFKIGQKERDAWMTNMVKTLGEALLWELDRRFPVRHFEGNLRARVLRSGAPLVMKIASSLPV